MAGERGVLCGLTGLWSAFGVLHIVHNELDVSPAASHPRASTPSVDLGSGRSQTLGEMGPMSMFFGAPNPVFLSARIKVTDHDK